MTQNGNLFLVRYITFIHENTFVNIVITIIKWSNILSYAQSITCIKLKLYNNLETNDILNRNWYVYILEVGIREEARKYTFIILLNSEATEGKCLDIYCFKFLISLTFYVPYMHNVLYLSIYGIKQVRIIF